MSLLDLQKVLNEQRANSADGKTITINAATITSAKNVPPTTSSKIDSTSNNPHFTVDSNFDSLIQEALMLTQVLQIQTATEIPPPQKDSFLQFEGEAVFLEPFYPLQTKDKTVTIPKLVTLEFAIDPNNDNLVHFFLTFQGSWTFQDSFPWLPNYPFNDLVVSQQTLIFSSLDFPDHYPWQNTRITLQKGLNYVAMLKNDGTSSNPLNLIAPILIGAGKSIIFSGIIDSSIITRPSVMDASNPNNIIISPNINLSGSFAKATFNWDWWKNLSVGTPEIVLETFNDHEYGQSFWLSLQLDLKINGKTQSIQSALLKDFNHLTFGLSPKDKTQALTIEDIIALAGGNDFRVGFDSLPNKLQTVLKSVGLRGANTSFHIGNPKPLSLNFAIGATKEWKLNEQFIIKDIVLQFFLFDPISKPKPDAISFSAIMAFFPKVFTGVFTMEIQHQITAKYTLITGKYEGYVSLTKILDGMSGIITLPENFPDVSFSDFGVQLTKTSDQWGYQFYGNAKVAFRLDILNGTLNSSFSISAIKNSQNTNFSLVGGLTIGSANFSFTLNLSSDQKLMEADWYSVGQTLGLNTIAHALGFENFSIPEDLDLALVSASFSYDFKNKTFVLTAASKNYGEVSISSINVGDKKNLIFFCHLKGNFSAKSLPLVGTTIGDNIRFSNLKFLLSSADFDQPVDVPLPPDPESKDSNTSITLTDVKRGVTFLSDLTLGSETQQITVPIYHPKTTTLTLLLESTTNPAPAKPDNLGGATSIGKSVGPFSFKNFGVSFKDQRLFFDMDASLVASGLQIHLDGLGLGFSATGDISKNLPTPKLDGLAVAFQGGPLTLFGGLVHNKDAGSYDGEVTIKLSKLMISALGSYAVIKEKTSSEGESSLFVFAIIDYPLGGPPFFFVTGGAVGFGYNRDLLIPGINGVREFPLIQAAFGEGDFEKGNLAQNLKQMLPSIPIKIGQNWFGMGVRFRSFNLINGFVLTTLSFGNQTEVNVLGLATAKIPFGAKNPIAFAEIALLARFLPDKGVISIEGALTNRSFIFSEKSRLTGGFAFYLWFDGKHAGDFVLTIGGYVPSTVPGFKIPDHYPKPDPVGLSWQVSDQLSIIGQSYFALTPSAIMAGGALNCQWHSGPLKAWFNMYTNFLIAWQPFHYDTNIAIDIGVSLRINLLFVQKTLTISVGAAMHLWGPEFSGKAKIEVWFVSFSISFGAGSLQMPKPISWSEFKAACFPDVSSDNKTLATQTPTNNAVCSLQVPEGLIKELSQKTIDPTSKEVNWFVSGQNFVLEVSTLIPVKEASLGSESNPATIQEDWNTDFGVNMVMVNADDFDSKLRIEIIKERSSTALSTDRLTLTPIKKGVPSAMWLSEETLPADQGLITNALVGFTITPNIPEPDETLPVPMENLLFGDSISVSQLAFEENTAPTSDIFDQSKALSTMTSTIDSSTINNTRKSVLETLAANKYDVDTTVNVKTLSQHADQYWLTAPTLSLLGEEKVANEI